MEWFDFFIGPYKEALPLNIALEIIAITASLVSVYYSFKNNVLVFPFGILSTIIYVYLLLQWNLLGDMLINGYYFIMSIYGWYLWSRVSNGKDLLPITKTTKTDWQAAAIIIVAGALAVYSMYAISGRLEQWVSYVDMLTTGIFFAGMWLMACRKLEYWLVLLVGNVISVPLYTYKGYGFSAVLYLILAIIAYFGYIEWKKYVNNARQAT
jgi:nicotinamide mononucleotide transporter